MANDLQYLISHRYSLHLVFLAEYLPHYILLEILISKVKRLSSGGDQLPRLRYLLEWATQENVNVTI